MTTSGSRGRLVTCLRRLGGRRCWLWMLVALNVTLTLVLLELLLPLPSGKNYRVRLSAKRRHGFAPFVPLNSEESAASWNETVQKHGTATWTCSDSCCISLNYPESFFLPEHSNNGGAQRPTHKDFLSPIDFKLIADLHYGEASQPEALQEGVIKLSQNSLPCLQPGVVLFVDSSYTNDFLQVMLPQIQVPFVLIFGDTDEIHPEKAHWDLLANNPFLLHWFVTNFSGVQNSSKISALPLGLSQWANEQPLLAKLITDGYGLQSGNRLPEQTKGLAEKLVLASFSVPSNPTERGPLQLMACSPGGSLSQLSSCEGFDDTETYLKRLAAFKFVFSPAGKGPDCYRTWEALLLGVIPIVKTSPMDSVYASLPVLIIEDWTDVTQALLDTTYETFHGRSDWALEKLYKGYWYNRFRSFGYPPTKYLA